MEVNRRKPCPKNRVAAEVEEKVCQMAIDPPAWGKLWVSNALRAERVLFSPTGVRSIGLRHDLETFKKRLKALEARVAQDGVVLTEESLRSMEKAREEKEAQGEIENEHPGYLGAQEPFYISHLNGVGRIYQQTFMDTYSKVAMVKVYDRCRRSWIPYPGPKKK